MKGKLCALACALTLTPSVAAADSLKQYTVVGSDCSGSVATFGKSQTSSNMSKPAYVCTVGTGRAVCYHTWTEYLDTKPNGGLSEALVFDAENSHKNAVTLTNDRHTLMLVPGQGKKLGYALISNWHLATAKNGETSLTARTCSGVVKQGNPPARPNPKRKQKGADRPEQLYDGIVMTALRDKVFAVETVSGLATFQAKQSCSDVKSGDALIFFDTIDDCSENIFVNRRTGRQCEVSCTRSETGDISE